MDVHWVSRSEEALVIAAGDLFDGPPREDWVRGFLVSPTHHLALALDDGLPIGFVSGTEIHHPDKAPEMLLYELGVAETHRRRGVGKALVEALLARAAQRGCRGLWVLADADDAPALATYRSVGGPVEGEPVLLEWPTSP